MQKQVQFGVLGYARIAKNELIPAMLEASNARPYAIASQKAESRQEAVKKFGFEKVYGSYEELLADPKVDAVYIPLPNALHKEWVIKAANAGKHVLCEKPLALTRADCLEMIKACRDNGVKLMEAFMYRFTTRTKMLKALLDEQIIGEVKNVNSTFRFYLDRPNDVRINPELGGGALWDVGCYPVNLIGMIMGEEPLSFCAQKIEKYGVDYSLSAVLKYRSGALCTVNCGFDAQSTMLTEINGTSGSLLVRDSFHETDTPFLLIREGKTEEVPLPACKRYVLEIEDFSDAILHNREPGFSLEETVRNVGLIEQILKAAK